MNKNFVLIGASGYIAPRHMEAIKKTGNNLIAAYDPYDGIGIMDSFFPDCNFFTEFERFDRFIDKWKRIGKNKLDYVSICSPNYLHDAHIRFALKNNATAICEKPIVLNTWNLDQLIEVEKETKGKVFTILQLRLHETILKFKTEIDSIIKNNNDKIFDIELEYITSRGNWYHQSWKGDRSKSGGISTNIGIHFFDMLIWVFGDVKEISISTKTDITEQGILIFKNANVKWKLSVDKAELPNDQIRTFRLIKYDGKELEFSKGFTDLHIKSYEEIIKGFGFSLLDARNSVDLASKIRNLDVN